MTFEVGDKVFYPPHGAGTITAREQREGEHAGEFLSIEIGHSSMTLTVPIEALDDRGVRPVLAPSELDALVESLESEATPVAGDPQSRTKRANDVQRGGDAHLLAQLLRDYTATAASGRRLIAAEQRACLAMTSMLASEIALSSEIEFDDAVERVEQALGVESEQ